MMVMILLRSTEIIGTFWMALEDYKNYFNEIYVVRLYHDNVGKVWSRYRLDDDWHGAKGGGCGNNRYRNFVEFSNDHNRETWMNNPQYGLHVESDRPVNIFVSLTQEDTRHSGMNSTHIGCYMFKTPNNMVRNTARGMH